MIKEALVKLLKVKDIITLEVIINLIIRRTRSPTLINGSVRILK